MMHAYQLRGEAPGDYAGALLAPEMKSFMQATGWQQTASDEQVRAAARQSWETLDADFMYSGRALTYTGENGDMLSLFAPNPLEAFAEAGGLYYRTPPRQRYRTGPSTGPGSRPTSTSPGETADDARSAEDFRRLNAGDFLPWIRHRFPEPQIRTAARDHANPFIRSNPL